MLAPVLALLAAFSAGCLAALAWSTPALRTGVALAGGSADARPVALSAAAMPLAQVQPPAACAPAQAAPAASAVGGPERPLDKLLKLILTRPDPAVRDPLNDALRLLKADARDRAELMARYSKETDDHARRQLRMLLMLLPNDDVVRFGMGLAIDGNPATRSEGYILLRQSQTVSPEARKLLLQAVATEQDTRALGEAVASLMPGDTPSPAEAAPVIEQLRKTLQSSSPEVRGESLLALSRWDRSGPTEDLVYRGLTDAAAPVQQAALTAVYENRVRSDRVKTVLLGLASDVAAAPMTRFMAVDVLGGFNLDSREHRAVAQLRDTLPPPAAVQAQTP